MGFSKGQGVIYNKTNAVVTTDETTAGKVGIRITATGARSTVAKGELTASMWAGEQPQLWEGLSNIAAFELIQLLFVGKKGLWNPDSQNFVMEEVLYEGLLKSYMSMMDFAGTKGIKLEDDKREWIDGNDFRNALDKTVQVGIVLDTIVRLIRKQPIANMAKFNYLLKMFVSFYVGNAGLRLFYAPSQAEYWPE